MNNAHADGAKGVAYGQRHRVAEGALKDSGKNGGKGGCTTGDTEDTAGYGGWQAIQGLEVGIQE